MTRQAPTIVRFSLSDSGLLSVLIRCSNGGLSDGAFKVQLLEHGPMSNAAPMEFVRVVQGMRQYQATLKPRRRFFILCTTQVGQRYRLNIPYGTGSVQYPSLSAVPGRVLRFLGLGSRYFFFEPGKRVDDPSILTNHDSVQLWFPNAQRLTLRSRKSGMSISSGKTVDGDGNAFTHTELSDALHSIGDGESLWDFYIRGDSDTRVAFWGPENVNPRKSFKYPWFWVGDERFSSKARIYWTEDGHLALKIIKKGLR